MHLSAIDANLIVALHHLLHERSVTRAARALGLSPSATSHTLARLRTLFDDELLVRAGRELRRTTRADELYTKAVQATAAMQEVLASPRELDPQLLRCEFSLAQAEYLDWVLLPHLDRRLRTDAPLVDLHSRGLGGDLLGQLRSGDLDMMLGVNISLPADFKTERVLHGQLVTIVRRGHPIVGQRLTKKRFASLQHILIAPQGRVGGVVDSLLAEHGLTRRVARLLASFSAAPYLVAQSDYVLTIPARVAAFASKIADFETLTPPLDLPDFEEELIWHDHKTDDPKHRWMRQLLIDECAKL